MKPRDKATSDPDTSHYAQSTAGKMTGALLVSSHPPRLVCARASLEALTEEIVPVNKSSTTFVFLLHEKTWQEKKRDVLKKTFHRRDKKKNSA